MATRRSRPTTSSTEPRTPWPLRRSYITPCLRVGGREFAWGVRTYIMGIINVTPDSFSGDGTGGDVATAVALARRFEAEGADILDIGGESTRPGAAPLSPAEERARVVPAIEAVRAATALPLSIDTWHAEVAREALAAGASMVNDVTGLRGDPGMAAVVAEAGVPLVAMHNQRGRAFHDVAGDIRSGFEATLAAAEEAGIDRGRTVLDPGFGFGWTPEQNLEMVRRLPELWDFGLPILIGPSRKSTIGLVLDTEVDQRLAGTAAAVALSIAAGADIVRIHDVAEMSRVARVADAIARANWRSTGS